MKTDETIGYLAPDFISAFIGVHPRFNRSIDFRKSVLRTLILQVDLSSQNPKGMKQNSRRGRVDRINRIYRMKGKRQQVIPIPSILLILSASLRLPER